MLERTIAARPVHLGGATVGRVLPVATKRSLGPFVFLDHMGPVTLPPGRAFDVLPHPHIGLATLTYLYEGESMHRDSLGVVQQVRAGDVNLMNAGHGVVHSERSTDRMRAQGGALHGLQFWLALPADNEDDAPSFHHADRVELPWLEGAGWSARVCLGTYRSRSSPVPFPSRALLVDLALEGGAAFEFGEEEDELGVFVAEGEVEIGGVLHDAGKLALLSPRRATQLAAISEARLALFGGDALDGPRKMFWNFVATSDERIERAKQRWRDREFPSIPGDDEEFVPLP